MKCSPSQVPNMKELAWKEVAEAAGQVEAGDLYDDLSLEQEEELVQYIWDVIIPWLQQQALSERSTTVEKTTK